MHRAFVHAARPQFARVPMRHAVVLRWCTVKYVIRAHNDIQTETKIKSAYTSTQSHTHTCPFVLYNYRNFFIFHSFRKISFCNVQMKTKIAELYADEFSHLNVAENFSHETICCSAAFMYIRNVYVYVPLHSRWACTNLCVKLNRYGECV